MLVINRADLKNAVGKFEATNEYLRSNLKQQLSDFTYNQIIDKSDLITKWIRQQQHWSKKVD